MKPFHEEDPTDLVKLLNRDHVVFGSDHPHVARPDDRLEWANVQHGLSKEDLPKVMGGNMMDLLGITAKVEPEARTSWSGHEHESVAGM
jgi:predicted TIM-barrel fold metal-dependent hydrolase